MLPDKPAGSEIREELGPDGLTLSWREGRRGFAHWLVVVILFGSFSVPPTAMLIRAVRQAMGNAPPPPPAKPAPPFPLLGIVPIAFAVAIFARVGWQMVRPQRPSVVRLGPESFWFKHGVEAGEVGRRPQPRWNAKPNPSSLDLFKVIFSWQRSVQATRSELTGFQLDRVGERQRLFFDIGSKRTEIGPRLTEPDREWLRAVLEHWRSPEEKS